MNAIRTPGTIEHVPNQPKNKHRMVRFSNEDWDEFGELAQEMGKDRSVILRQFAQWWMRRPGVKLPERPPQKNS